MIAAIGRSMRATIHFKFGYREYVLGILVLGYAVQYLNRQVTIVMAQPIKAEFALSDAQLGLLTGFVFSIPCALMIFPAGMIVDRVNRRNLLIIALSIWSCLTAITGLVHGLFQLAGLRAFIAVAEAPNNPNSLSMLADLYDRPHRATAAGIYYGGPVLAALLGFPLIAFVGDKFGWRAGFVAAGLPGLLLAVVIYLTIREPIRERTAASDDRAPPLKDAFRILSRQKSVLHFIAAITISVVVSSGTSAFMVPLLMRKHGMSLSEAGLSISLCYGITTLIAHILGGLLADRLAQEDLRWYAWFPAIAAGAGCIFMISGIMSASVVLTLAALTLSGLTAGIQFGPVMGSLQSLVIPRMRGVATSSVSFFTNLVGGGVGPLIVGILSDVYMPWSGIRSLGWALATISLLGIWALFHYLRAAKTIISDFAAVRL